MPVTFVSPKKGLEIVIKPANFRRNKFGDKIREAGERLKFAEGQFVARTQKEIEFLDEYARTHQDLVSRIDRRSLQLLNAVHQVIEQQSAQGMASQEFAFATEKALHNKKIIIADSEDTEDIKETKDAEDTEEKEKAE